MTAKTQATEKSGPSMKMSFDEASYAFNAFLYFYKEMPDDLQGEFDAVFLKTLNNNIKEHTCRVKKLGWSNYLMDGMTCNTIVQCCVEPLETHDVLSALVSTCREITTKPTDKNQKVVDYFAPSMKYIFIAGDPGAAAWIDVEKKRHLWSISKNEMHEIGNATDKYLKKQTAVLIHSEKITEESDGINVALGDKKSHALNCFSMLSKTQTSVLHILKQNGLKVA